MLNIYLTNGATVRIEDATQVESTTIFRANVSSLSIEGLVCKDAEGRVVGEFKLHDISGYAFGRRAASESIDYQTRERVE
jgi:hypothetical protein